ncbi:Mandelate racemase/muconate lactonizing enzyme family protein [Rhodovastum atsumiense]|uniref:Mandelate racemase/muconate lactonizing enzyme family protein n=1 Tax=Rhodovastum atsumiense TaxID=504468 RepID=A0A5M6IUU1_9PROT|nr:mandelate racemase/muconate lactonizing enzyme family protein [Rhodovastum atsumiense]KAA5611719.1 mandelate racemase/muconate lactonizing enzyme family protein [Rhodovastum atsumiense]CAH2604297.1 Mandelate racemase/muconate lactonizing enzyme family protein [Rhodovastum atsumiense]
MSRIRDISIVPVTYRMDPGDAYGTARGLEATREAGLVILDTEDGVSGIGEVAGPGGVARAWLERVREAFLGTSVFAQRGVARTLLARHPHPGLRGGLAALLGGIDIAAHDAMGKLLGVPVSELIGGRQRDRVPVYASGGYFTADADQDMALEAQLDALHASGVTAAKIRIGRSPADDLMRVRMARRLLGERPLLLVEAGGGYTTGIALESMRRITPFGVHWYEEPLAPQDWHGYAALAQQAPMPVAAGAALSTLFEFHRAVDGRIASVLQPDLTLCGGFEGARAVEVLARAGHLRLSAHCRGTGVGLVAALHWVASLPLGQEDPSPVFIEYDVGRNPLRDDVLTEPPRLREGMLEVPTGPGLGIALDPDAVKRFSI